MTSTAQARDVGTGRGLSWKKARQLLGLLYVLPTMIYVLFFFVVPILLVAYMSGHSCNLLTCTIPNPGKTNFPNNYASFNTNTLFWPAVWFTIEYTVLATFLLVGIGLSLAMLVQTPGRWIGFLRTSFLIPGALGLATASLLYWGWRNTARSRS